VWFPFWENSATDVTCHRRYVWVPWKWTAIECHFRSFEWIFVTYKNWKLINCIFIRWIWWTTQVPNKRSQTVWRRGHNKYTQMCGFLTTCQRKRLTKDATGGWKRQFFRQPLEWRCVALGSHDRPDTNEPPNKSLVIYQRMFSYEQKSGSGKTILIPSQKN
jgi:hypothetical protein